MSRLSEDYPSFSEKIIEDDGIQENDGVYKKIIN